MEALKTLLVLSCPYSLSLVELNSEEKTQTHLRRKKTAIQMKKT